MESIVKHKIENNEERGNAGKGKKNESINLWTLNSFSSLSFFLFCENDD